ncbi:Sterol uptake control protein 2 [Cytospora mali]|uniref:Sterol uptake control protein 2 n=1 Tax=Cytospora mali TaxID=578113 RepID=A0A194VE82_CYTMA|nr:Sterol uptake control protein 2 [Valsa mali var. pyri (nom. inval.)]
MPPRRSHKKSRAGCRRCKTRKIKCDEIHPRCGNCVKHGVPCDFEHPSVVRGPQPALAGSPLRLPGSIDPSASIDDQLSVASLPRGASYAPATPQSSATVSTPLYRQPGPPLPGSQPIGRLTELRLMHHYTTHTYKTLSITSPEIADLWGSAIPHFAFSGSTHLVDAILAVAALHLRSLTPNDTELVRASHAYMASCLNDYSNILQTGINANNAVALFLTSTLIAFQSTATRIFTKDESPFALTTAYGERGRGINGAASVYQPPLSWFHSFQGVKTVVAASWPWLKENDIVLTIIDSQPVLHLNFSRASEGFFGHLLEGLDEELAAMGSLTPGIGVQDAAPSNSSPGGEVQDSMTSTRQAYQHAVATLNWAHTKPGKGALAFPATVSKRFVELLEERRPRALAILASFLALLKVVDNVWWLHGMARREVLGIVSLFNSDYFGPDIERKWWPHLEWAVRIALYDSGNQSQDFIPADIWGSSWTSEQQSEITFTTHIEMLSELVNPGSPLPPPPNDT